ncbi:MAG: nucleotide sugar dehydrogenase [Acidobacteriota bacterium]
MTPNPLATQLHSKIASHDAVVGIIGLGYVGLPLALAFAEKGFPVLGFDVDPDKVAALSRGEGYIKHLDGGRIAAAVSSGRFVATTDFARLGEPDAILVCVPTPLTPQREPDMRYVETSARQIKACLRPGQLVILESTTYPGTTDELLKSILESASSPSVILRPEGPKDLTAPGAPSSTPAPSVILRPEGPKDLNAPGAPSSTPAPSVILRPEGPKDLTAPGAPSPAPLLSGTTFFLAFSPEREDPGRQDFTTTTTPKVVGGVDPVSGDLAQALYNEIISSTVRVSSARAAEATKLMENIFRAVNIALVNELKVVYDRMGIDIWEVLDAAETKPFGFMRFNPGPGWGGHCIPLDPFYLSWKAREVGVTTKFIELAGEVNVNMPRYVVEKLQRALNDRGKPVKGSKILILGIAYKRDIDDDRESPAYEIMDLLEDLGAEIAYHDPHVPRIRPTRRHSGRAGMTSLPLTEATLAAHDAVVIVTDHRAVDYDLVARHAHLVVDTRGALKARPGVVTG